MNISVRGRRVPASPIRKLVPLAIDAERRGIKVYHLNIGQPDIETPPLFWEAIKSYGAKVLAYGNSQGDLDYIDSLIRYYRRYGIDFEPEDIVVTVGGSEAIVFSMLATSDPGDEFIIFEPFYTNYNGYAVMAGVKLVPITTSPENGYHLPAPEVIEEKITERTRGIFICTPNNPTGTVLTREEMEMIADIAERNELFVISDEVYREFVYEGNYTSVMHLPQVRDRAILLDSVSKRFSACGARIGNIASKNGEVMRSVLKFAQARLCPPSVEQYAARNVFDNISDEYYRKMRDEYRRRRDVAIEELEKIPGAFCRKPSGAFYIMATLPVDDIEDFARWMLTDFSYNQTTTMIAPGPGFYATETLGKKEARIAYVLREEEIRSAMRTLAIGIERYNEGKR